MIQIGPVEIDDVIIEAPIGVKTGQYRTFNIGDRGIGSSTSTVRLQFRMDIDDPMYEQLVELCRSTDIRALPFYTGYKYLNGLYNISSFREELIGYRVANINLVIENAGHYFEKIQDTDVRRDDWNMLFQEDFESYGHDDDITTAFPELKMHSNLNTLKASESSTIFGDMTASRIGGTGSGQTPSFIFGFDHWRNYEYSCWVMSGQTDPIGIGWRCESGNIEGYDEDGELSTNCNRGQHYELVVDMANKKYLVEYHSSWDVDEDTVDIIYQESHDEVDVNKGYKLGVITIGYMHFCFVNGTMITYFKDKRCRYGSVGIVRQTSADGNAVYIDDIVIHQVPHSVVVADECYTEATSDMIKTRRTTSGQIGYCEDSAVSYKATAGGQMCALHLRFDQNHGEKVYDHSKYRNHADITSAEWQVGFMRFTDSSYITIPYDASLNTADEGTLIIRMRRNNTDTGTTALLDRGSSAWRVNLIDASIVEFRIQGDTEAGYAPHSDPLYNLTGEFQTYVVRWSKTVDKINLFCDGISCGGATTTISAKGSNTSNDLVIGYNNVDIEYIVLYDNWIEYPFVADGIGVKLYDVDVHDEDEIIDLRFDVDPGYVREYWNDLAVSYVQEEYEDDAYYRSVPLLYRRGALRFKDYVGRAHLALPNHIAGHIHEMDWTAEIITGVWPDETYDGYILTLGDNSGTRTVAMHVTTAHYLKYYITNQTDTQEGNIQYLGTSQAHGTGGAFIVQVTYQYQSKIMRFYINGVLKVSLTLNDDLGTTSSHLCVGQRGTGNSPSHSNYYRTTLIARTLDKRQIRKRVREYRVRPQMVFSKSHDFSGYPTMDNGLLSVRPVVDTGAQEFGERPLYEMYDDGRHVRAEGDVSSVTEPLEIAHRVTDDRGTVCSARIWDTPVLKSINQDELWVELRQQLRQTDAYTDSEGFHITNRIGMSVGLFTLDTYSMISTRAQNWKIYFRFHDMQVCWREGGWLWHDHNVVSGDVVNIRGNFYAAAGTGATGYTMDANATPYHYMNHSIFMNINPDASTWSDRDYMLGLMGSHQKDYLNVPVVAADDVIESFFFDELHKEVGGEFRFAICLVPHDVSKHYSNEQNWTNSLGWANDASGWGIAINDNVKSTATATGDDSNAVCYEDITFNPGSYKIFVNMFHNTNPTDLNHMLRIFENVTGYDRQRAVWHNSPSPATNDQLWWDTDLVINDDTAKELRLQAIVDASSNTAGDECNFDGLVIIPCYNGADFPLDQLYSARNLKQIKRRNK